MCNDPAMNETDLIGSAEACRLLGDINRSTLTRWVLDGRLSVAHKLPGNNGAYLFERAEIARVRAERQKSAA